MWNGKPHWTAKKIHLLNGDCFIVSGKTFCQSCKKKCSGEVLRVQDKYFHIGCFKCAQCNASLALGGFFTREGSYYCTKVSCTFCVRRNLSQTSSFNESSVKKNSEKIWYLKWNFYLLFFVYRIIGNAGVHDVPGAGNTWRVTWWQPVRNMRFIQIVSIARDVGSRYLDKERKYLLFKVRVQKQLILNPW